MTFPDDSPTRRRVGKKEREALFKDQRGRCNYCGIKLPMAHFHVDHTNPLKRGGSDRLSNLQLICGPCNTRKGKMTDGEFRRRYKLVPTRKVEGPPDKVIPIEHFEAITKSRSAKKAKQRRKEDDGLSFWS